MATYEYRCQACREEFTRVERISEHASSPPACPKCGSSEVRQLLRSINVQTSRKS
jgi:putative FmdB family regulatory protein